MLGLFKAFIFLFLAIGGGAILSKLGSKIIKKDGVEVVIWLVWLFLVFTFLGGDFPDSDNYRPN